MRIVRRWRFGFYIEPGIAGISKEFARSPEQCSNRMMAGTDLNKNPLVDRVKALRTAIDELRQNGGNRVNHVQGELEALGVAWARTERWIAILDLKNPKGLERLATLTQSAVSQVKQLPDHGHGPEYDASRASFKATLSGLLTQVLLQGLLAIEKDEDVITKFSADGEKQLIAQKEEFDQILGELKKTLESSRAAAVQAEESAKKVGVTVHMTAFSTAADSHRRSALFWAAASGLCATFLAVGALSAINEGNGPPLPKESWYVAANLSHYLARALVVSLVSFLMVFFTRNFRSAKHNEVVNRHRAGALATRDTLLTAQGNRGDDVVNLHVAEAVFAAQPSGYVESDGHGTHVTELLDFVRNNRV